MGMGMVPVAVLGENVSNNGKKSKPFHFTLDFYF